MKRKLIPERYEKDLTFHHGLREISVLRKIHEVKTPSIINFINVAYKPNLSFQIIFPFLLQIPVPMNLNQIDVMLNHLLKALKRLAECNLEHRDIKPHNIMYNPIENLYTLIDFDVARIHSTEQIDYCRLTAPPECLPSDSDLPMIYETFDGKADVCALALTAIIFHNMKSYNLRGNLILYKHLNRDYFYHKRWIRDTPAELIETLTPMLEYDPIKRSSASELLKTTSIVNETIKMSVNIFTPLFEIFFEKDTFEEHVLNLAQTIFNKLKIKDNEKFSYFLGCLEIASNLMGNKNYTETFYTDLFNNIILRFDELNTIDQVLLDRKFVLINIINTTSFKFL